MRDSAGEAAWRAWERPPAALNPPGASAPGHHLWNKAFQIFRYFHLLIPSSLWAACNIETHLQDIHEYFKKVESGQEEIAPGNLFIEHQSVKGVR